VVGVLPGVENNFDFFNTERVFSKMKKDAVFMNVGRGATVNEDDLIQALKQETIKGAVLDVFKTEPLPTSSELW
jgi:phosphoglycerate dehydrogenase-like enzyme